MNHSNLSASSLHDNNYYDISINRKSTPYSTTTNSSTTGLGLASASIQPPGNNQQKKKYQPIHTPRRVGSLSSLSTLNEPSKRPGDYYIQKLSNSSLNLNLAPNAKNPVPPNNILLQHSHNAAANRPISGDSILSLQSNLSDDISSVGSSQFDFPDSRLSSLTSNSILSPSDSPAVPAPILAPVPPAAAHQNGDNGTILENEQGPPTTPHGVRNINDDYIDEDDDEDELEGTISNTAAPSPSLLKSKNNDVSNNRNPNHKTTPSTYNQYSRRDSVNNSDLDLESDSEQQINSSLSTITLQKPYKTKKASAASSSSPPNPKPTQPQASTRHASSPAILRQTSSPAIYKYSHPDSSAVIGTSPYQHHDYSDASTQPYSASDLSGKALSTTNIPRSNGAGSNANTPISNSRSPRHALQRSSSISSGTSTSSLTTFSTTSNPGLTRTKSRYLNPKEKKERQQQRKKLYDDNDNDDEILSNDLDLVFNVPVIQSQAQLYMNHNNSSKLLSHTDLVANKNESKYNIQNNSGSNSTSNNSINSPTNGSSLRVVQSSPKPFPLPGKLSKSTSSLDTLGMINNSTSDSTNSLGISIKGSSKNSPSGNITGESIIEEEDEDAIEDELNGKEILQAPPPRPLPRPVRRSTAPSLNHHESHNTPRNSVVSNVSNDNDAEITQNISDLYNERSTSYSKLVKMNREQDVMYKLPAYIKSQSSVEDLNLFSPEKLNYIDQSRPINLPPKAVNDKMKHKKEFHKVLTNFELNTKATSESRKKSNEQFMMNQQHWFKLMLLSNEDKDFAKKLSHDKYSVRKLAWESVIPDKFRFDFFFKVMSVSMKPDALKGIAQQFDEANSKYERLSPQMKLSKDNEFDRLIESVLDRPLFQSILMEFEENPHVDDFSLIKFKSGYKHLLYIESLSQHGLKKHDEMFLIPLFLIMFQNQESIDKIFKLIEMFNIQVLNSSMFNELNKNLNGWSSLISSSSHTPVAKALGRFNDDKEFEQLGTNNFFEILIQINDKLPLSMSAPSTPILAQPGSFGMGSPMPSLPGSPLLQNNFPDSPISSSRASSLASSSASSSNPNSIEGLQDLYTQSHLNSSSLSLVTKFLQVLLIYSHSAKTMVKNNCKICQSLLIVIFKYYHINWNDYHELIKQNKSIRLNKGTDQNANLDSFVDKWKDIFKRI